MRITRKVALAVMAAAALIGGTTTAATAATSVTAATAACTQKTLAGPVVDGGATAWMRYNTCNRDVWGKMYAPGIDYYWHIWVYNENTRAVADYWDSGGTVYTPSIDSAGTYSHVCIQPYSYITGSTAGSKVCTGYAKR